MNPETALADVGPKLYTAAIGSIGPVRVCWIKGEFVCLNSTDRQVPELVVARYRPEEIIKGLSNSEWTKLSQKLAAIHNLMR